MSVTVVRPGLRLPVTALVLAKDEEVVIARAIRSVSGLVDEVLVVDSESRDSTRGIAEALGARVVVQPWLGWLDQKAVGLREARHDWVFSLDADEIVSPELAASVRAAFEAGVDDADGLALVRDEEFLGEIMPDMRRRSKRVNFVRLFNKTVSGWDPALIVHEEVRVPGEVHLLDGRLVHWRNYSIGAQLATLNRNSDLEATMIVGRGVRPVFGMVVKPVLRFAWIYLASGSWRKGMRGFAWASLHAYAEFLRNAKAWERTCTEPAPHPPESVVRPFHRDPVSALVNSGAGAR